MSKRESIALAVASALVALSPPARGEDAAPPPLTFSVTPGAGGAWKLRVENTGDVPVRIAADPRLLILEVTPPAGFVDPTAKKGAPAAKPVRCILPDDARPATDSGRELVIPSKRAWSQIVDPLLYCFSARERAMLVVGATVKAHFGWPSPPAKAKAAKPAPIAPPFVAEPVGAAVGRVASVKELEAAPITLTENATSAPPAATGSTPLSISLPESQDVARGNEISTTVTLANDGDKPVVLLFRPETVRFSVAGPAGSVPCGSTRVVGSPIRELFSTLGVKAKASVSVLLTAACPSDTFDEPGIYRVTPMLDTSGASGRPIGLKTWDGTFDGRAPMLLRVRTARRAATSPPRPVLD